MVGKLIDKFKLWKVCHGLTSQNVADLRVMRHDLCNHLCAISGLAQMGDTARLNAYILDMLGKLSMNSLVSRTGLPALDALLSDKLNQAAQDDLILTLHTASVPAGYLTDLDLITLTGQLLDHAFAGAKRIKDRARRVELTIEKDSGFLVFRCTHPTSENKISGATRSVLRTVRKCARRYSGVCKFIPKDGRFLCEVYIPLNLGQTAASA